MLHPPEGTRSEVYARVGGCRGRLVADHVNHGTRGMSLREKVGEPPGQYRFVDARAIRERLEPRPLCLTVRRSTEAVAQRALPYVCPTRQPSVLVRNAQEKRVVVDDRVVQVDAEHADGHRHTIRAVQVISAVDVDNTLIDNDGLLAALARELDEALGAVAAARFWQLYEASRAAEGASPAEAARRLGDESGVQLGERAARAINSVEPRRFVFPGALEALRHLRSFGPVLILSEGDARYQQAKIERAGLPDAVDRVVVVRRKTTGIRDLTRGTPVDVFIDDKPEILDWVRANVARAATIHVRQGKYATAPARAADAAIQSIADLIPVDIAALVQRRVRNATGPPHTP